MLDKNMHPVPGLALSWEPLSASTWRLKLRRGVRFHNGEPFDAAAAKYSIERATQSRSTVRTYLQDIKDVRIVDDFTIDLTTTPNNPLIIPNLCCMYVLPPKYHQQVGDAFRQRPSGHPTAPVCRVAKGRQSHHGREPTVLGRRPQV